MIGQREIFRYIYICGILVQFFTSCSLKQDANKNYADWRVTGGTMKNIKYSTLSQIDTSNVSQLKIVWEYHSEGGDSTRFGVTECNPIIVDGLLYGVSPRMKLFALNARTGEERWVFDPSDPEQNNRWVTSSVNMNRGVAYWEDEEGGRIIHTVGTTVFAINAKTGDLISTFGEEGGVDLRQGLDRDPEQMYIVPTSPVMIYKDIFIVSGLTNGVTPGHIRGFDVKTGEQKWIFHTIPYPGEYGYETWDDSTAYRWMGSTKVWSGFSLDEKRGIVYGGTSTPTHDFFGGDRKGSGLFGNSILALDAETGERIWHYQTVHHDVWDMDISSPPILVTLSRAGKKVDAIAQTTKTGMIFVLDRETGEPLFPIEEREVDTSGAVEGEELWSTQPFPVLPKPFTRQRITENDLNTLVSEDSYQDILHRFRSYRHNGIYTPPSIEGTLVFPGYDGGGEWGGPAFDIETDNLIVNANEMAWILKLVRQEDRVLGYPSKLEVGKILYEKTCMTCHGPDLSGGGDHPSLLEIGDEYGVVELKELIRTGRRMMPGFSYLSDQEKEAIALYVLDIKDEEDSEYEGDLDGIVDPNKIEERPSYSFTGYNKFLTKEGYPAISPPWGTLNAVNLNTGEYVWKVPFGEFEELKKKGIPTTGRENYGGPVVTSGGLIFIAATADSKFRAFNKYTGEILFETSLPAPGVATPAVYAIDGKQYVVIASGGSKWGGPKGDSYVAFSLPEED